MTNHNPVPLREGAHEGSAGLRAIDLDDNHLAFMRFVGQSCVAFRTRGVNWYEVARD
jgi:hypothetical protein